MSDAAVVTPSTDVPADMNTGAITISRTNTVDKTILAHIKVTTVTMGKVTDVAIVTPDPVKDFPTATVAITPQAMTTWEAGKISTRSPSTPTQPTCSARSWALPVSQSFTMSAN